MRIIYGVAGEGRGHSTRSQAIIDELSKKHDVLIVGGGQAYNIFSKHYKNLVKISCLHISYRNNAVSNIGTAFLNLSNFFKHVASIFRLNRVFKRFKPDVVISDFELFTNYMALIKKIPNITLDNEHAITKTKIGFKKRCFLDYFKSVAVVKSIILKAKYYLVTSFFFPGTKTKNTFLFYPILRKEILNLKPIKKDHILVYQTSKTFKKLIPSLLNLNEEFIIYGLNQNNKYKNLIFRDFNENLFFKDLATCKAVITNGGFSLMTEAIYLHKPVLSIPVRKQFEQILNAKYLKKLGYGEYNKTISKEIVEGFVSRLDFYEQNLKKFKGFGNKKVVERIESILKEIK